MLMMMMLDYVNLLVEYIIISVLILSHKDNYICCLFVVYILYIVYFHKLITLIASLLLLVLIVIYDEVGTYNGTVIMDWGLVCC